MFCLLHRRYTRGDFWYAALLWYDLGKTLIRRTVVGCINCLVDVVDMGWSICQRNVASRDMEFHQRAALLREAHTTTTTANRGHNVQCCWSVLAQQTKARASVQSVIVVIHGFPCVGTLDMSSVIILWKVLPRPFDQVFSGQAV